MDWIFVSGSRDAERLRAQDVDVEHDTWRVNAQANYVPLYRTAHAIKT